MKVSLNLIFEKLRREFPEYREVIRSAIINEFANVERVGLLPDEGGFLDPDVLWMGNAEKLSKEKRMNFENLKFLLYGPEHALDRTVKEGEANAVLLGEQVNLARIFNYVGDFLKDIHQWQYEMELAIVYGKGLQALLNAGKKLIANPVIIWNPSFELQAYTDWIEVEREPVAEIIERGKFPGKVVKKLIEMGYLDDPHRFDHLAITYPPNWVGVPFVLRVFSSRGHNVVSMVQYFMDEPPMAADLELLHILELHVERYMKDVQTRSPESGRKIYEPFLIEMLQGKFKDDQEIRDRLEYVRMPFTSSYVLLEIKIAHFTTPLEAYMMRACKTLFPFSKRVAFKERIFTIINLSQRQNGNAFGREKLLELSKVLLTVNGKCGVSRHFSCLNEMHVARLEADAALDFLDYMGKDGNYAMFQDIQFYTVLKNFSANGHIPLTNFVSPELLDIYTEDVCKNNDNIRLLDFYLNHNCNITDTAKEMNLHRNSVIYRLGRIEDRLNVPLSDPEARFRLQFMLKVLALPWLEEAFGAMCKEVK